MRIMTYVVAALLLSTGTQAADQVKLGLFSELSGPISPPGTEAKRAFDLALDALGNKLGGLPVKVTVIISSRNVSPAVRPLSNHAVQPSASRNAARLTTKSRSGLA
jgi:hypothetical protein